MTKGLVTAGPAIETIPVTKPDLLLLDIDEVVLHFIDPFSTLLEEFGARLTPSSFRLTGNVHSIATGAAVSGNELDRVTQRLYEEQEERQMPVEGVGPALTALSELADIVFLTAMTPSHYESRRRLLDKAGLRFPMIATQRSKGGVAAELMEKRTGRLVFVDDLPPNLVAVSRSVPEARLVHLMATTLFRDCLPPLPPGARQAKNWPEATDVIRSLLAA
ncbi:hypothetical protein [Aureimonas psammosilenae]|uniref:hypothetical protein n=1 Tax=Aureimonas psammosilenae TaxID=2495496 RepID=UPI001F4303D3|nr:hypothetical protein [Aureimonas psammosilenae]